jgi:hypothetical protein
VSSAGVPTASCPSCVVISHWTGHPRRVLHQLLSQMQKIDAGSPFDLVVVCNGGDREPLVLPRRFDSLRARIVNRANTGYNIGAWEAGRCASPDSPAYLFLQDECFIQRAGWLSEYEYRFFGDAGVGLLGESLMWDRMSWPYIRAATDRDLGASWFPGESVHPLDQYQQFLDARAIPLGAVGTHLQSLVLFSSAAVLRQVGGFPVGSTYRESVACEIGISCLIAAQGYRIAQVRGERFSLIGHRQWTSTNKLKAAATAKKLVRQMLGRNRPDPC